MRLTFIEWQSDRVMSILPALCLAGGFRTVPGKRVAESQCLQFSPTPLWYGQAPDQLTLAGVAFQAGTMDLFFG